MKAWEEEAYPLTSKLPVTEALLLNVQNPVIVWSAALDAGPLTQSSLTTASVAEPVEAITLNILPSKEMVAVGTVLEPPTSLTSKLPAPPPPRESEVQVKTPLFQAKTSVSSEHSLLGIPAKAIPVNREALEVPPTSKLVEIEALPVKLSLELVASREKMLEILATIPEEEAISNIVSGVVSPIPNRPREADEKTANLVPV